MKLEDFKTELSIKNLEQVEYEQWLTLWQGYQQFYQANISKEVTANTWSKLTDPNYSHVYGFAALYQDEVVGIVHMIEHESCWTIQPYGYLQDLYTLEDYRGKGIARALIKHVHEYAIKQRQCDRVYWLTHQENTVAQQLYDSMAKKTGFIQYRI